MEIKVFKREDVDSCVDEKSETLIIPEGIEEISEPLGLDPMDDELIKVKNYKKVVLPSTLKKIGKSAFEDCYFDEVKLPESLEFIGENAFHSVFDLKMITIPENTKNIEEGAFENCRDLTKVILPSKLEAVSERAFNTCLILEELILPETVKKIGKEAFTNCVGLKTLVIPKSVSEIGEGAFYNVPIVGVYENSFAEKYCLENDVNYYLYSEELHEQTKCFSVIDAIKVTNSTINDNDEYVIDTLKIPDNYEQLCLYGYDWFEYDALPIVKIKTLFIPSNISYVDISVDVDLIVYDDAKWNDDNVLDNYDYVFKSDYEKENYTVKNRTKKVHQYFEKIDELYKQGLYKQANDLLLNVPEEGQATAFRLLGDNYRDGLGFEKDLLKAEENYKKAVEEDNQTAAFELAELYLKNHADFPNISVNNIIALLELSTRNRTNDFYKKIGSGMQVLEASEINKKSLILLGKLYFHGSSFYNYSGLEIDLQKAQKYFQLAIIYHAISSKRTQGEIISVYEITEEEKKFIEPLIEDKKIFSPKDRKYDWSNLDI